MIGWGVSPAVARALAADHPPVAVAAALERARRAKAQGRLRNPAGFLVRCLAEAWVEPTSSPAAAPPAERTARALSAHRSEADAAAAARGRADAAVDALDDATLAHLADRVVSAHADRPAFQRLLTAKPPRASRLMRAEIAALLEVE